MFHKSLETKDALFVIPQLPETQELLKQGQSKSIHTNFFWMFVTLSPSYIVSLLLNTFSLVVYKFPYTIKKSLFGWMWRQSCTASIIICKCVSRHLTNLIMSQCPLLLFFCHPESWLWPIPVCHHWVVWMGILSILHQSHLSDHS
jgi:hypothetical protein